MASIHSRASLRALARADAVAALPGWVRVSPSFWGWFYWSAARPVVQRCPGVLGGVRVLLQGPAGQAFALGSPGCRARCFRLCLVPPSGSARLRWFVWCGRGRAPSRAVVVAWFAQRGAASGWRVT